MLKHRRISSVIDDPDVLRNVRDRTVTSGRCGGDRQSIKNLLVDTGSVEVNVLSAKGTFGVFKRKKALLTDHMLIGADQDRLVSEPVVLP